MSELVETCGQEQDIHNIRKDEYDVFVAAILAEQDPDTAEIKDLIKDIYDNYGSRAAFIEEIVSPIVPAEKAIDNCRDLLGRIDTPEEARLISPVERAYQRMQESRDKAA